MAHLDSGAETDFFYHEIYHHETSLFGDWRTCLVIFSNLVGLVVVPYLPELYQFSRVFPSLLTDRGFMTGVDIMLTPQSCNSTRPELSLE